MKDIFIASSAHPWNDPRVFLKEARSLAKKYSVELHAPADFKYKKVDNVHVYGLPQWRLVKDRKLSRKIIFQRAIRKRNFIFHFHDPELIPLAIILKLFRQAKIIYDIHEDVPRQILTKPYINKKIIKPISMIFEMFEAITSYLMDALIVTTIEIFNRFRVRNIDIIRNYPLLNDIKFHDDWEKKKNEIVYIGVVFKLRGTLEILKAISKLDVRFNLAGKIYPESFKTELINSEGWNKTKYWGFINREQINNLLSRSKIGMVILRPDKCYMEILPVKMFEYMIAGLPIIASKFPKIESIINKHHCGICVDPMNIGAIQNAITYLMDNPMVCKEMGENGRRAVLNEYNWKNEEKKLFKLYKVLMS